MIPLEGRPASAPELLRLRARETPREIATFHRDPSGTWIPTTWEALWADVRRVAEAFRALGLEHGDRLAILARTCREWQLAEFGAYLVGAAVVGIDAHASPDQVAWILERADVAGAIVDTLESAEKTANVRGRLKFLVVLDQGAGTSGSESRAWRDLLQIPTKPPSDRHDVPDPDTVAMLIYTSGTTGDPKGIEYTHRQLMVSCWAMIDEFTDLGECNRAICWLPMAPLFQRMINFVAFASRSATYFVEDPRDIMARIAEVRPTVFTSVPRFYEKLHDGIQEKLATQHGFRKLLVHAALAAGAEVSHAVRRGNRPPWRLRARFAMLDFLVLRKIRAVMGGEIKWMLTGSAAAPVWLLEFFHSIGLLILEAYGVTENPIPVASNRSYAYRFGSVGRPYALNQVRVADDSEVLVKGPAMFHEYRGEGRPAERFTADGYYRTGDYGRLDQDGFLYLTGRVAEMIKTSTGRRISPVAIEAVYGRSRYIDQIVVVGNDRPCLVALVTLNVRALEGALGRTLSTDDMQTSPEVLALVDEDIRRLGAGLSAHEQIRAFAILPAPLTIEHGELTSTLKLRRERIAARHEALIGRLYPPRLPREQIDDGRGAVLPAVATGELR